MRPEVSSLAADRTIAAGRAASCDPPRHGCRTNGTARTRTSHVARHPPHDLSAGVALEAQQRPSPERERIPIDRHQRPKSWD
jgi:hypothetical protein